MATAPQRQLGRPPASNALPADRQRPSTNSSPPACSSSPAQSADKLPSLPPRLWPWAASHRIASCQRMPEILAAYRASGNRPSCPRSSTRYLHEWLGIPASVGGPNHYQLLGLQPFETNVKAIENAADRQMAHLRTPFSRAAAPPSRSGFSTRSAAARICLLEPDRKADLRRPVASQARRAAGRHAAAADPAPVQPVPAQPVPLNPVLSAAAGCRSITMPIRVAGRGSPCRCRRRSRPSPSAASRLQSRSAQASRIRRLRPRRQRQPPILIPATSAAEPFAAREQQQAGGHLGLRHVSHPGLWHRHCRTGRDSLGAVESSSDSTC